MSGGTLPRRPGRPHEPNAAEIVYFRCPRYLIDALDELARKSSMTRSKYISEVLLDLTGMRRPLVTKMEESEDG
jgi:hypothetical protein